MTNLEWLATLTPEEFATWALDALVPVWFKKVNGEYQMVGDPDPLAPRLHELKIGSSSSFGAVVDWCKKEHVDIAKTVNKERVKQC